MRCPCLQNLVQWRLHLVERVGATVARPGGIEVKKSEGVTRTACTEHPLGIRPVSGDDAALCKPRLLVSCVMCGDRLQVEGGGMGPGRFQFNPEHGSMQGGGIRRQLNAASTSTIEQKTVVRERLLGEKCGSQHGDLPWRCKRFSFNGVVKEQALR